jgi:hypothetical protein
MTGDEPTRLVVERVDKVSRRPWVFVTGRLEGGGALSIGDSISVAYGDNPAISTVIRSIEVHSPPGRTTIAIDAAHKESVGAGAVITPTK